VKKIARPASDISVGCTIGDNKLERKLSFKRTHHRPGRRCLSLLSSRSEKVIKRPYKEHDGSDP